MGADNNVYLAINQFGGHPNGLDPDDQDANIWAVRRYVSEVGGPIRLDFDLRKINTNPNGGGITGHIFVDGSEVFSQFIATSDDVGVVGSLLLDVGIGSLIDFAIDPTGVAINNDGIASARADGTHFSALVSTQELPLPATAPLVLLGPALLARRRA